MSFTLRKIRINGKELTLCNNIQDIGIRKSEFVAKSQFLCLRVNDTFLGNNPPHPISILPLTNE